MAICTNACPDVPGACEDEPPVDSCGGVTQSVDDLDWDVNIALGIGTASANGGNGQWEFPNGNAGLIFLLFSICNLATDKSLRITSTSSWNSFTNNRPAFFVYNGASGLTIGIQSFTAPSAGGTGVVSSATIPLVDSSINALQLILDQDFTSGDSPNYRGTFTVEVIDTP